MSQSQFKSPPQSENSESEPETDFLPQPTDPTEDEIVCYVSRLSNGLLGLVRYCCLSIRKISGVRGIAGGVFQNARHKCEECKGKWTKASPFWCLKLAIDRYILQ